MLINVNKLLILTKLKILLLGHSQKISNDKNWYFAGNCRERYGNNSINEKKNEDYLTLSVSQPENLKIEIEIEIEKFSFI